MFRQLFSPRTNSPLHDALLRLDMAALLRLEENASNKASKDGIIAAGHIAYAAGDFMRHTWPQLEMIIGAADLEIISLEALIFSSYSVRTAYVEPQISNIASPATEAFQLGFSICAQWAEFKTGRPARAHFERRLAKYAHLYRQHGTRKADSEFDSILSNLPKKRGRQQSSHIQNARNTIASKAVISTFTEIVPRETASQMQELLARLATAGS